MSADTFDHQIFQIFFFLLRNILKFAF